MSFPVVEMQQQQQEQEQEQSSNAAAVEEGRRLLARLNTASDAQLARSVCAPLCTRFVTFGYAQKCIKTSAFRVWTHTGGPAVCRSGGGGSVKRVNADWEMRQGTLDLLYFTDLLWLLFDLIDLSFSSFQISILRLEQHHTIEAEACDKRLLFSQLPPYVCPEPVLAKWSF
jgi:hypothetical protein